MSETRIGELEREYNELFIKTREVKCNLDQERKAFRESPAELERLKRERDARENGSKIQRLLREEREEEERLYEAMMRKCVSLDIKLGHPDTLNVLCAAVRAKNRMEVQLALPKLEYLGFKSWHVPFKPKLTDLYPHDLISYLLGTPAKLFELDADAHTIIGLARQAVADDHVHTSFYRRGEAMV